MTEKRIIKKYPNRRLYDTEISKYITMDSLKDLVLKDISFSVIDVKTDEDLTRSILLQIIAEQEHSGEPIFSTESLTKIIQFYGDSVEGLASDYISQSLELFTSQQKQLQEQLRGAVDGSPMESIASLTKQNIELWNNMQNSFFEAAGIGKKK